MTTFEDRERAFETKFTHDEEFRFLVGARRDKLFAYQVAEQLGLAEPAAGQLTAAVLALRDGPGHDEMLLGHMARVFSEHGCSADAARLAASLAGCAAQARQQLLLMPPSA